MLRANSFNSVSSSFVLRCSIISETPPQTIEAQFEDIAAEDPAETIITKASTFLHFVTFFVTQNNVEAHKSRYKHLDIALKLSTIPSESIISTHRKTFIKTEDLVYSNKLKKHSKVWDYNTQLIEVQSRK